MKVHLRIRSATTGERVLVVDGTRPLVFGRSRDADVPLEDPRVSRLHFRLEFPGPGTARLVEIESPRNGTFVGGQKVERTCPITTGSEITVGSTTVMVRLEAPTAGGPATFRPGDEATAYVRPPRPLKSGGTPFVTPLAPPPDLRRTPDPDEGTNESPAAERKKPARDPDTVPPLPIPAPPQVDFADATLVDPVPLRGAKIIRAPRGASPPREPPPPPPAAPEPARADQFEESSALPIGSGRWMPAPEEQAPIALPEPALPPAPPLAVPGYSLDRLVHRADYGATVLSIYLAYGDVAGAPAAVKVLRGAPQGSSQLAIFQRGAAIWSRLRHPRIVALEQDGSRGDPPFVAMEYMPRGSLEQILSSLRGGVMVADESLRILIHMAEALHELERQGVVHRAVQPSNILVAEDGSYKLSDFFLAKDISPQESDLTRAGRVKGGSPYFMAPEQLRGGYLDGRSDIYALGAVFYLLLAGRPPYAELVEAQGDHLGYLGSIIASAPPPPMPDLGALPPGLDRVILRSLDPDPGRRYTGATALLHDLAALGLV